MNIEMMRHRLWITILVLCGLLATTQLASAQDLTPEQEARILQRFPQADRDGDGKLSSEEIEPLRELIEKAREKRKARTKQTAAKPKGPAQTANDNPQPDEAMKCDLFNTEEILDESTLDIEILKDWHVDEVTGSTRQKLIEINVAEWWPGQDYRIPVRMIVPLEGKAKGFSITGANPYETLMKDSQPDDFQAKLLANGVGIVKTHVKRVAKIPGKKGQLKEMEKLFMEDPNPRYTQVWIWSMTLMRAATAVYAETDHFEKGKVAGSGSSKNGISPAVALINDERFTATCSNHAFAYYSPARKRRADRARMANEERSQDKLHDMADCLRSSLYVTENWDRLMERGVDILFTPGTHDYVAFDIVWGAQNHPQLPVYYKPGGGHSQTPHVAAEKDDENRSAFLWHHFFGGEPLLKPPKSNYKVDEDKLNVSVSFNEGPQPISGRIWWIYDRAPEGSRPFLSVKIPEDQWMDMECDAKTGAWTATIPLKDGFDRIDFFSNHGHMANGYKQYLSSPYTRVELSSSRQRKNPLVYTQPKDLKDGTVTGDVSTADTTVISSPDPVILTDPFSFTAAEDTRCYMSSKKN